MAIIVDGMAGCFRKLTVNGAPNQFNYCEILIFYTQFTNFTAV